MVPSVFHDRLLKPILSIRVYELGPILQAETLPPGLDKRTEEPHHARSIAQNHGSTTNDDDNDGGGGGVRRRRIPRAPPPTPPIPPPPPALSDGQSGAGRDPLCESRSEGGGQRAGACYLLDGPAQGHTAEGIRILSLSAGVANTGGDLHRRPPRPLYATAHRARP